MPSSTEGGTEVMWTKITLVGCPGMECQVRTTDDGRTLDHEGEPIPFERRPRVCNREGRWMLGRVFLCAEHARETAALMDDDIDEIEAAWKAQL